MDVSGAKFLDVANNICMFAQDTQCVAIYHVQ